MQIEQAREAAICRIIAGSRLYGTNTPDSDTDIRGVFIAPIEYCLGLKNVKEVEKLNDGEDETLWEIRQFFKLLTDANPNILDLILHVPIDNYLSSSLIWERIVRNRELFLSKKVKFTYSGYAMAQLKRIETHRKYILDPPSHKPTREEFDLPENSTIPKEQRRALLTISSQFVREDAQKDAKNEINFNRALEHWKAYQSWYNNRNPERRELEIKCGYDSKHASHLIRLIRMGKELLGTGDTYVRRWDAKELLEIRNGHWSYEQVMEYTQDLDEDMNGLYEDSPLPKKPNHKKIEELLMSILEEEYYDQIRMG